VRTEATLQQNDDDGLFGSSTMTNRPDCQSFFLEIFIVVLGRIFIISFRKYQIQ
jgi:hypothetical protein